MTLEFWYWFFMGLWLAWGVGWCWRGKECGGLLQFLLFLILGIAVYGWPIKG